ncbi:CD81 [Branchiostoma lanceolatum]|uniref:Tetraspanin n=1 Tax=Branchiostoma lanceolatum TaxID=7740 RepID=A0A8J9ZKC5_BRALA|nr:CD81 [Branchiostoma lanceolatum]
MGCCSGIIRVLLFIFNFVFWLVGLALLGIGIWLIVDPVSKGIQSVLSFYGIAVYIIIAAGAITTVVGFLGCCGACKESKCLLIMFSIFLGIIFAVEVAAGIVAIVQRGSLTSLVTESFADILTKSAYLENAPIAVQAGVEAMQTGLQCCGLTATADWNFPAYAKGCSCSGTIAPGLPPTVPVSNVTTALAPTAAPTTAPATTTSGVMGTTVSTTTTTTTTVSTTTMDPDVCVGQYWQPCVVKLKPFLEDNFLLVGVAALVFSVVQIIGICFSCIVIKNANDVTPV